MPLVSCIMPTFNRWRFVALAVRYFLAQDYVEKELVIVDDGTEPVADLLPQDPRVRYFLQDKKQPLGAKRNFACEQARGEIMVHWDDDDWSAPWRLRYQVEELCSAKADICGLERVFFYAPHQNRAWEYVYADRQRRWVYGASLCYMRAFWQTHRFPEISVGEDTKFVWASGQARIHALPDSRFLVALIHDHNTSPKRTADPRYRTKPVVEIEALLGKEVDFYRKLAGCSLTPVSRVPSAMASSASQTKSAPLESFERETNMSCETMTATRRRALITASLGIGDILRVTPLIRVAHRLGYEVDVLLATDYADAVALIEGGPEVRRVFHVPSPRRRNGASSIDGLSAVEYEVATFTTWSARLKPHVKSRRTYTFDQARWLIEGDSASVGRIAREMGWKGEMPPPFAMASSRQFGLPPGTVAIHPGCKYEWPWKKWHGFDELSRRFQNVVIIGTEEDLRTDNTYFRNPFKWPAHARNFIGQLNLSDTAALLRECAALIANDSGLMHLGVVLGVPTFGVFGITSPGREAVPAKNFFPLTKGMSCEADCRKGAWGRRDCHQHLECLKSLTPQEVMQQIMNQTKSASIHPIPLGSAPPTPVIRRHVESITVAVEITGGLGDVVLAGGLLSELHRAAPECVIEVFYHTPETARFVFHNARFIRGVQPAPAFAEAHRRADIVLSIHSLVRCEIRAGEKIRRVNPAFAASLEKAIPRFESFRGFFDQQPQLDGVWGRVCVQHGQDRRSSLGWLTGIPIGRETPLFLAPEPREYDFFARCFPDPSTGYITIHDGFDNNVRLAPGAATKCWPLRHWTALVQQLKEVLPGLKIVQLGGLNSRQIPGVDLDLVQKTSLAQAAWFLKHAQVHIDGDSGMVHLARALHTPSVVLFGPTNDQFFGYRQNINLTPDGCRDCWWSNPTWLSRCPRGLREPECMTVITPERVSSAVSQVIKQRPRTGGTVLASAVYGQPRFAELDGVLGGIFDAARMPSVPISRHGHSEESGLYLHASKQWEYLFAWQQMMERFDGRIADLQIADVGGGRGALAAYLAGQGAKVKVFDTDYLWDHGGDLEIESRFLRWAHGHGYEPRFGSLFNLPLEDSSCDVVTSISVVEHVRHKLPALKEALRVLKPGGLLILTFDFSLNPERHLDSLRQEIFSPETLDQTLAELGIAPAQIRHESVAESARIIQAHGVLGIPPGMTVGGVAIVRL